MISVIIPVYNRKDDIIRCLDSIESQSCKDYEVIVIDDCSSDDIATATKRDKVKYIRNSVNSGPSLSRNIGVNASVGDILLFLDSDVELPENVMLSIRDVLTSDETMGCFGGCGPLDSETGEPEYIKAKYYDRNGYNISKMLKKDSFTKEPIVYCDHFESACLGIRRDVFLRTGGFDPYWFYIGEDRELCLKVRRMGFNCAVSWESAAIHHENDLSKKIKPDFQLFCFLRYLEVAYKLDGITGAVRWMNANKRWKEAPFLKKLISMIINNKKIDWRRDADFLSASAIRRYTEERSIGV